MKDKDVGIVTDFMFFLQGCVGFEVHSSHATSEADLEVFNKIRNMRSKWMNKFVEWNEEELYCRSKHLMQIAQGMKEVGVRFLKEGKNDLAKECFEDSKTAEACFMLLNKNGNFDEETKSILKEAIDYLKGGEK